MRVLTQSKEIETFLSLLRERASGGSSRVEETVKSILSAVKRDGDEAVIHYTEKLDSFKTKNLRVTPAEIVRHANKADRNIVRSLERSVKRIRSFHNMQREESWVIRDTEYKKIPLRRGPRGKRVSGGTLLGQVLIPLKRVGVYVPGGKASYPSTVLMNVIPAQVAGVGEIALSVPTPRNEVNPYVMAAIEILGVKEVYRMGGAQAIGAMAYGTKTVPRVDKIVGPGNIFVAMAKKLVFGEVDIDMIAGPSEVLIIADKTANRRFIAADLLSQAEHDELASSILITDSGPLAVAVQKELKIQLSGLKRKEIAENSIRNYGAIIVRTDLKKAVQLSNEIAPEHLEILTHNPFALLSGIRNAGAIFLGPWTPEPLGDYAAGPNHTLPTGGTARFFSPLGVYDFVKRSSLLSFSRDGFMRLAKTVMTVSEIEGLNAHGNTIRVRLEKN
ncbi:MAG TPA: histidinol dehydrogenase [Thermodesulfovibrionales bacterium]|nr:histidinol dehydrogenase [Thermodesulfovibrionales bacterium]